MGLESVRRRTYQTTNIMRDRSNEKREERDKRRERSSSCEEKKKKKKKRRRRIHHHHIVIIDSFSLQLQKKLRVIRNISICWLVSP